MKWIAVIAVTVAGFVGAAGASAAPKLAQRQVLTYREAVEGIRQTSGYVRRCRRLAPNHFRCLARYWFAVTEEETNEETGEVLAQEESFFWVRWKVDVGLKGVRVHER
ncbi:MAG TPA: hypothetical protein VFJ76_07745 [Solirubrobacterales bacterium]|nr:hypothetical protein [Solirubrobacterales bacterium]